MIGDWGFVKQKHWRLGAGFNHSRIPSPSYFKMTPFWEIVYNLIGFVPLAGLGRGATRSAFPRGAWEREGLSLIFTYGVQRQTYRFLFMHSHAEHGSEAETKTPLFVGAVFLAWCLFLAGRLVLGAIC